MATALKGFKQVTLAAYQAAEDKVGYLWFVRSDISGDTYEGDIYFGTRHYGHFGGEVEELATRINGILSDAGIVDESGNTVVLSEVFLKQADAEEIYVKKETLYNTDTTGGKELGVFIISGSDVDDE